MTGYLGGLFLMVAVVITVVSAVLEPLANLL